MLFGAASIAKTMWKNLAWIQFLLMNDIRYMDAADLISFWISDMQSNWSHLKTSNM